MPASEELKDVLEGLSLFDDKPGIDHVTEVWVDARTTLSIAEIQFVTAKFNLKRVEAGFMMNELVPGKNATERDAFLFDHFIEENTVVFDLELELKRARTLFDIADIERKRVVELMRLAVPIVINDFHGNELRR